MSLRNEVIKEIELRLGGGMVDVELDRDHYDLSINKALRKFRQRSQRATTEQFIPLVLKNEQQEYQLPLNVVLVRDIFLRHTGNLGAGATGSNFDPFDAMYLNNMLLQNAGGGMSNSLLNYELYADRRELMARMFGGYVTFNWLPSDHKVFIHRKFKADDVAYAWCFVERDEEDLLTDPYCSGWIRDYAFAQAKFMLGEARSKFATIAGPQGGTSLNGDNLKSEAQAEIEKLEIDLTTYVEGGTPLGFIIG